MYVLNKVPVVVRPKQPFADWVNTHSKMEEPFPLEKMRENPNVYLMYDYMDIKNKEFYISDIVDDIFDFELRQLYQERDKAGRT